MERREKVIVQVDSDFEEIIPKYLRNQRQNIKSIFSAIEKEDFETICILGHNMKGNGMAYGFDKISSIACEIEKAAKKDDTSKIIKQTEKLSEFIEHVEVVYI